MDIVQQMSEKERLAVLEAELEALQQHCQQSELSREQLRRELQPLISAVNWSHYRETTIWLAKFCVIVLLVALNIFALFSLKPVRETSYTYTRIALIKLLPFWDWTSLYEMSCLLENPLYKSQRTERAEDTCQLCESIDEVERTSNLSVEAATDNYLRMERPVIVTDATHSWPVFQQPDFDRYTLAEMFMDESLVSAEPCQLVTNLRARGDMHILLRKITNPLIRKWYAHWENCDKRAAKALRTLYRRPYFLPAMIDSTESNWVLISSNYTGRVYKTLPVVNDMVWLTQIQGTTEIRLTPRSPCSSYCPEIVDTLRQGEILMFTDFLWMMEYLPGHGTDNIAFGVGGFWE